MIVAIVVFAVVARLAIYLLPHNRVRHAVVIIDDVVLIGLVAWFGWELFVYLWNRRERLGEIHTAARSGLIVAASYLPRTAAAARAQRAPSGVVQSLAGILFALTTFS